MQIEQSEQPEQPEQREQVQQAQQAVVNDMRARLRALQTDVDELRAAHRQYRVPSAITSRWHEETYFTSFARSRVVALFAILYAVVSITLHPQIRQCLLTGEGASAWLWPTAVRLTLLVASCGMLIFGALTYRKRFTLPLGPFTAAVKIFVAVLLITAATDVAVYPGATPDLTGFAISMCLAAVALVTPDRFRIFLYVIAAMIAFFGWWFVRGAGPDLLSIGLYASMIAGLCIALDRLTHRQRVGSLLSLKQAELQESIARELIDNTLPKPISRELAQREGAIAQHYDAAIVLFADLVGFTQLAAKMSPNDLLAMLDDVFRRFDTLVMQHGMEKIKTIGDAYMAAGGLTQSAGCNADHAIQLGLDMHKTLNDFNERRGLQLALRVGIHQGPVVAGVIGDLRFAYDIWGDTVNTASRLESSGIAGRVHISQALYQQLKDKSVATLRGEIDMKGLGRQETWLV
jgi:class 3 adenylate cyclase